MNAFRERARFSLNHSRVSVLGTLLPSKCSAGFYASPLRCVSFFCHPDRSDGVFPRGAGAGPWQHQPPHPVRLDAVGLGWGGRGAAASVGEGETAAGKGERVLAFTGHGGSIAKVKGIAK